MSGFDAQICMKWRCAMDNISLALDLYASSYQLNLWLQAWFRAATGVRWTW